jgi:uncharacterized metal-binding protein YceD (DUF177 family)
MPELATKSPSNPEFARVLDLSQFGDSSGIDFDVAPDAEEAAAIARLMGAQRVKKLRLSGQLSPLAGAGWRLEATLGASVVQTCVVTLDPVTTRIDQAVRRSFLPESEAKAAEVTVEPDEDDEIEPLSERIDLGLVAIEALALALPAYPRKPGATLAQHSFAAAGLRPLEDEELRPFAVLAALKDKLGSGS